MAVQEIMASQSHFTERDAVRRVAELAAGRGFGSQILVDAVRNELRTSNSLIRFENQQGEPRYTTQEMLDIERRMLHSVAHWVISLFVFHRLSGLGLIRILIN